MPMVDGRVARSAERPESRLGGVGGRSLPTAIGTAALLFLTAPASAQQTGFTEGLRVQGGYTHQTAAPDNLTLTTIPAVSFLYLQKRAELRATYAFTFSVYTGGSSADIANRLNVSSYFDLSQRTGLVLTAEGTQTTVNNALTAAPASATTVTTLPTGSTNLVTARISEGLSHQVTPVVRTGQALDGLYSTQLEQTNLHGYYTSASLSLEREWPRDALGGDVRTAYSFSHAPPFPDSQLVNIGLTPHWRHDISRQFTASLATGASVIFSPQPGTRRILEPFVLATLLYAWSDSEVDVNYFMGVAPNQLTAQPFQTDRVGLHASTPLSVRYRIAGGTSISYAHSKTLNLFTDPTLPPIPSTDAVFGDVDVGWSPVENVQVFARYQIYDQIVSGAVDTTIPNATPPPANEIRHLAFIGVQLSSRLDTFKVRTSFPQRVDRGDPAR
jgi:hypothetical protein